MPFQGCRLRSYPGIVHHYGVRRRRTFRCRFAGSLANVLRFRTLSICVCPRLAQSPKVFYTQNRAERTSEVATVLCLHTHLCR